MDKVGSYFTDLFLTSLWNVFVVLVIFLIIMLTKVWIEFFSDWLYYRCCYKMYIPLAVVNLVITVSVMITLIIFCIQNFEGFPWLG